MPEVEEIEKSIKNDLSNNIRELSKINNRHITTDTGTSGDIRQGNYTYRTLEKTTAIRNKSYPFSFIDIFTAEFLKNFCVCLLFCSFNIIYQ